MLLVAVAAVALTVSGCSNDSSANREAANSDGFSLVGLGDSLPGGLRCSSPCRSYVALLGETMANELGKPVTTTNLATNDSLTSTTLLTRVTSDETYKAAIAAADAVTVQIGFNDWQGSCYWPKVQAVACVGGGESHVREKLGAILDEVSKLRNGAPTTIWVVGYYDSTIGDPNLHSNWSLTTADELDFHAFYTAALADFNTMLCEVAVQHQSTCVGLIDAFNGASGDGDPGTLLASDHLHPSQTGHELIATTISATGYAPLG